MLCHRIGRWPIGTIGLGMASEYSRSRSPRPPQKITTFIGWLLDVLAMRARRGHGHHPRRMRWRDMSVIRAVCTMADRESPLPLTAVTISSDGERRGMRCQPETGRMMTAMSPAPEPSADATIDGVQVVPLRRIPDERGTIFHMLRRTDPHFVEFGEIYFSTIYRGVVKGWHRHDRMTLNYACIAGRIKLVLYDDRLDSPTRGSSSSASSAQTTTPLWSSRPASGRGSRAWTRYP